MSWSASQFEMESAVVPANDNSLIINTALASRRRHVAGLLREQLKNKTRFRPAASITRGRSDFSILDHYRTQGSAPSPVSQSSRVASKSPPPMYRSNLRTTADLTGSPTTTRTITNTSTETRHATIASTTLISNERQRYKNSNDETLEEKTKKSLRERSPSIHEKKSSIYGKVEGRVEQQQYKKSPTSVLYQQDSPSDPKEIHLPSDRNDSKKGLTLDGAYDGTTNSLGGHVFINSNNTSIAPMVINVPTISTPDDNDTVLTTSTSDQHEDLVRDLSNKFASVGGKETRVISAPPTISICTNLLPSEAGTQQHTTMPISVRGRAKLYDVQRKVSILDSGEGATNVKKLLQQKQQQRTLTEEQVLQHCTTSNSTSDAAPNPPITKKLVSVPTYFTPTRCWEVAPKPQPFKPMIQGKCGVAAETSSASCGEDNATRASSSSISGNNEFKERCRERQLEYLKHSAASNSSRYQRKDRTAVSEPDVSTVTLPPPPPPTSPPPSLLPTEYYAALSSALKINESLRRRIAYLEKELALTRKIDTRNDTENGLHSTEPHHLEMGRCTSRHLMSERRTNNPLTIVP